MSNDFEAAGTNLGLGAGSASERPFEKGARGDGAEKTEEEMG
jgi:hypothetical protein